MSAGGQLAEHLSMGILGATYRYEEVQSVVEACGKANQRIRSLPAETMVYYVMAMGLFMAVSTREVLRVLLEGCERMGMDGRREIASKAALAQARERLGPEPLRQLWLKHAVPIAPRAQKSAFLGELRLVALDGTTLDVPDTEANRVHFGKASGGRGGGAFPQMRLTGLIETGTHGFFAVATGPYATSETSLARQLLASLKPGMLCLADRLFAGYALWSEAAATGAQLLWRIKQSSIFEAEEILPDGSYLSTYYKSAQDRQKQAGGTKVRIVEYAVEGAPSRESFRLMTTLLNYSEYPAQTLASLYPERWEMEGAFDELKTHLRGGQVVLRSKTPPMIEQELFGLLLAHRAVRLLMQKASRPRALDPDHLSFTHTVRVVRRKLAQPPAFSP